MDITLNQNINTNANQISLNEALENVPKQQRDVFMLKTHYNYSTKEICKVLKIDEKQFWTYIHDTRKLLINTMN